VQPVCFGTRRAVFCTGWEISLVGAVGPHAGEGSSEFLGQCRHPGERAGYFERMDALTGARQPHSPRHSLVDNGDKDREKPGGSERISYHGSAVVAERGGTNAGAYSKIFKYFRQEIEFDLLLDLVGGVRKLEAGDFHQAGAPGPSGDLDPVIEPL
jgi:hypothetical protein